MSYENLSSNDYDALYSRYLARPTRLLAAPDPPVVLDKRTRLLDLCSGPGTVVKAALGMGLDPKNITVVEESRRFASELHRFPVNVIYGDAGYSGLYQHALETGYGPFHLVTCRQAVNYWWNKEAVGALLGTLFTGGCFVFNTFNTPPSEKPAVKRYQHVDGNHYAEIAYLVGDTVHHAQAREGLPMHMTTFKWIPPEVFADDLDALVETTDLESWTRAREKTTDTYVCRVRV